MYVEIKTDRLCIRSMQIRDTQSTYSYQGDRKLTKYMMFLPDESLESTREFIEGIEEEHQGENPRRFEFVIFLGDEHIGGISVYKENDNGEIVGELGWIMREEYQGKGYITEAAVAVMDFTFNQLGLGKIIAHCDARNKASARVMEKLGMTLEHKGTRQYSKTGEVAQELKYSIRKNN